jgi:hypothetical protein
MPTISVAKAFTLQLEPKQIGVEKDKDGKETPLYAQEGERLRFDKGVYDVPDWVAAHWYVLPHLDGYVEPPPRPEMADYVQRVEQASQAARNSVAVEEVKQRPPPLPPGVQSAASFFAGHEVTTSSLPDPLPPPPPAQPTYTFAGRPAQDQPPPQTPSWMARSS